MYYRNRASVPLVFRGTAYPPGSLIPATVDPAQLAAFARQGIVEATTAPPSVPSKLRRVTSPRATAQPAPVEEDGTDGHDRSD